MGFNWVRYIANHTQSVLFYLRSGGPRAIRCFFHNAVSHQNGRFTIRTVVPGDYKLFAWEEIEPFAYNDPDVLRRYEEVGIPLKVSEAAKLTVEAKMIPAGQ